MTTMSESGSVDTAALKTHHGVLESAGTVLSQVIGIQTVKPENHTDLTHAPEIVIVTGKDFVFKPFYPLLQSE